MEEEEDGIWPLEVLSNIQALRENVQHHFLEIDGWIDGLAVPGFSPGI